MMFRSIESDDASSTVTTTCQESQDSATESESDAEEEGFVSENDLEIMGEESHTVEEAGNTNSTGAASGGTETPAKKAEVMLTPEHQAFVHKFKPAASKMDKPRKSQLGHISGRGASTTKLSF